MIQRSERARNAHGKRWGGWQPSRPAPAPRNRESEPGASPGFVLVDLPALHHEMDVLERRDVALWIALDGDQVREGAGRHGAQLAGLAEQLSRHGGSGPHALR